MASTILLLLALVAPGDPVIADFRLIPPGHDMVLPGIGQVRYFTLEEYVQLADFDYELYLLRRNNEDLAAAYDTEKIRSLILHDEIATLEKDKEILAKRCMRLSERWNKCEEDLVTCNSVWWPWAVAAGGVAVGIVGMVIALGASFNVF